MKKVFIINHYAGAPKYGMEYRHYDIASELVKKGIEVCIIASSFTHLRKEPAVKKETINGISFRWVKTPKYKTYGIGRFYNMLMFSIKLFFIKNHVFKPDTIIVSSPSPFPIMNALAFKRKFKAKLLYEIRDVWPKSITELKGVSENNIIIKLMDYLDTKAIKKSDAVLSPLHNIKEYIKSKGLTNKIIILPNGISDNNLVNIPTIKNEKFTVGYGGSLGDTNSIMNLIEAAILLKNNTEIAFKIIGDGERLNDIKNKIEEHQLSNIELIGRVDKTTLFSLLKGCDILYKGNPYKAIYTYGISSIKMVEYLLLKKPVIDASVGVNLIDESGAGISVLYENSQALSEGIIQMKGLGKESLMEMGDKGYNFALNKYLYANIVTKALQDINEI